MGPFLRIGFSYPRGNFSFSWIFLIWVWPLLASASITCFRFFEHMIDRFHVGVPWRYRPMLLFVDIASLLDKMSKWVFYLNGNELINLIPCYTDWIKSIKVGDFWISKNGPQVHLFTSAVKNYIWLIARKGLYFADLIWFVQKKTASHFFGLKFSCFWTT